MTSTHPYLDPALSLLWRAPRTLQVGLDPAVAVALADAPPDLPARLARLRGVESVDQLRSSADTVDAGTEMGRLLSILTSTGLLGDGAPAARRAATWVEVVGDGAGAAMIADSLRGTGIARCTIVAEPTASRPDLTVVAPSRGRGLSCSDLLVATGTPHLWAHVRDGRAVIGPLVLPGQTSCLRCQDLHRTESDPAWPQLAIGWEQSPARPPDPAALSLLTALATRQVLAFVDCRSPAALAGTLEEQPDGTVLRLPWPTHAGCGCGWGGATDPTWSHASGGREARD